MLGGSDVLLYLMLRRQDVSSSGSGCFPWVAPTSFLLTCQHSWLIKLFFFFCAH